MKKIIITGANGFIGNACIQRIRNNGFEIHAISTKIKTKDTIKNVIWHQLDISNKKDVNKLFSKIKPEYLLHLAWDTANKDYDGNHHYQWVKIGIDLIEAFDKNGGKRIVVSGTCAEYDWDYGYCSEKFTPIKCQNAYGLSKHTLQLILDSYCKQNNLSYAWGRIFFAYGPGMNPNSLIPYVVKKLKAGEDVNILNGNLIRDYIYIDDIADIFIRLLDSDFEGPINVSTGIPIKINKIVNDIGAYFGKKNIINFGELKYKDFHSYCVLGDNYRLFKNLQWQPKIGFEEGLKRTIESML